MTQRFVNGRSLESSERLGKIATELGLSLPTLAVAWSLSHDFVGSTLIGATGVDQLEDTLSAAEVSLSPETLQACDEVTRDILYPLG